ncbi:MAG TPA: hypothetical protein VII75_03875 [Thermoanaerobaculia bacterium]
MAKRGSDINADIEALFQLPLADFTGARNALAKRLKGEGRTLDAERVKALPKPPAPAWAVNQLYWQDPKSIERLLALGERVRKAQTGKLKNADLRALLDEKKEMTTALITRATAILEKAGHAASPDATRRVSATLESLAAWGDTDGLPQAGRLTADLDPPGFDTLVAMMGGKNLEASKVLAFRPASKAKPAEDPAATRARLREAVQAAEKVLREARRDADRAASAQAKADAHAEELEARYAEAKEEARAAASEARKTAQAVAEAERAVGRAKAALEA